MHKRRKILAKLLSICLVFITLFATQTIQAAAGDMLSTSIEYYPFSVTILHNGGRDSANPSATKTVFPSNNGQAPKLYTVKVIYTGDVTKQGYTFAGYLCREDGKVYKSNEPIEVTSDITLLMQWTPNTYQIKYDDNGGANGPASGTKTHGKAYIINQTVPKKDGYVFAGWKCDADDKIYQPGDSFTLNKSCTFTAQWEVESPIESGGYISIAALIRYIFLLIISLIF